MIFYYYLIAVNVLAFFLMGTDKYRAKHHRWRIPEKTLFHPWGDRGCHSWHVYLPPQNKALVFRCRHAADSVYPGRDLFFYIQIRELFRAIFAACHFPQLWQVSLEKYGCIHYYHYKYTYIP